MGNQDLFSPLSVTHLQNIIFLLSGSHVDLYTEILSDKPNKRGHIPKHDLFLNESQDLEYNFP